MSDQQLIAQTNQLLKHLDKIDGLSLSQAQKIANELRDVLRFHNKKYYEEDAPVISDFDYDKLFSGLKTLEEKYPELVTSDSPTQKIAVDLQSSFAEVEHMAPMLSLDNTYNAEELADFEQRLRNILKHDQPIDYMAELKFDGIGIALLYENDRLVRAATRGDGARGEDVTENIKTIAGIPKSVPLKKHGISKIEIRGEIIMPKKAFQKLNQQRQEEGLSLFANPRNAAAGSIRQLDTSITKSRDLICFLYHISYLEGEFVLESQEHALKLFKQVGLPVSSDYKKCHSISEVLKYIEEVGKKREDFPFEIDGLVIKVNNIHTQEKVGYTQHHPRWAVAYKFSARQGVTKLNKIVVQVGRTGVVTPVAELEPVQIGGVTVSAASLYNWDYVRETDLREGDTVVVERAGDVIPRVVRPLVEKRTGKEKKVKEEHVICPSCGSKTFKIEDEVALRCLNPKCPAQLEEKLKHFASKDAMDIESLGDRTIALFLELKLLHSVADIYRLADKKEQLLELEGFGDKSVENLLVAIEKSKSQPSWRLVHALSIPHVGKKTAKLLVSADEVKNLWDMFEMDLEQLQKLSEIGPVVAQSVKDFYTAENKALLLQLEKLGLNFKAEKGKEIGGPLSGKTFLFTGELQSFSREEAGLKVEKLGGKVVSSISSKTTYLVVGENAGSKLAKAQKLGVKILNEKEFLEIIGQR